MMTVGRCLLILGFVCLTIMVFTHVAERLLLFSGMGWGLPHSPGHFTISIFSAPCLAVRF